MKKHLASYSLPIFFAIAGMAVLCTSLYSRSLVNFFVETSEANIRQRLLETAKRLSERTFAEELDAFRVTADMERQDYHALRQKLIEFAKDADVLYVYFMREENGKMQYIVDNDLDEKTRVGLDSPPEPKEQFPDYQSALEGKVGVTLLGSHMPGWEGLVTSYAPVYNRNGQIGAYLGVDINADIIVNSRQRARLLGALQIVSVIIVIASGIFGFLRYRREARAAQDANDAKSRFLSRMSHEIRTPLTAIIGLSELAAREYGQPKGLAYLADINQAGDNLLAVVNDILDFSKIESGKLEIRNAPYETANLFSEVFSIIRARLAVKAEHSVRFISDIAPDIPASIVGDKARVREILLNLLSNAVKYTEKGCIAFTASCRRENGDSIALIFKVADSGIGIRREDMGRLFADFSRVDDTRASAVEGTGLGLSITRQLCRAMGGDVQAQSEYGAGSTFTATIRQTIADSAPLAALTDRTAMREGEGRARFHAPEFRILIVDDNAANLKAAEGHLAAHHIKTDACTSGKDALRLVREREYGLVLMDNMMPEMDGIETLAAIRALGGRFERLPVVAFTANAMTGIQECFMQAGFDGCLTKPIELPKLDELLERWVPAEKRRGPDSADAKAKGAFQAAPGGAAKAELAAWRLDLLNHYRWRFANDPPADAACCHAFSALAESMDVPPNLREDMASLAAAGRRGDCEEIRRLLPGVYGALAASVRDKGQEKNGREDGATALEDTLRRLKTALDAGDSQGIDAGMDALRNMDALSAEARALYCLLNDALLMDEPEKASAHLERHANGRRRT